MKKIWLAIVFVLLAAASAEAQKTCTKNAGSATQTCTVTIGWTASVVDPTHDAPTLYTARRADAGGAKAPIGNVAASITQFQNVFVDTGGVTHCWDVTASNTGGTSGPSPEQCWTTPALQKTAPNAPPNTTLSNLGIANLDS